MINGTCTATFADDKQVHMMTVASAFIIGRGAGGTANANDNTYLWTGYDGMSHNKLLDIIYFFERENCIANGLYNLTMDQSTGFIPEIECVDNGAPVDGLRLQNFVYDLARSVQTYRVGIYGLEPDQVATVQISDYSGSALELRDITADNGHGVVTGENCTNNGAFTYQLDPTGQHQGWLEYASFNLCEGQFDCWETGSQPDDYCFRIPSPWDSTILVS